MTTITNFIQGNFIINPQSNDVQRPVWVLNGNPLVHNVSAIIDTFLWRCSQDKKPVIRLDLGLGTMKSIRKNTESVTSQNGVKYWKMEGSRACYVVGCSIQERKKPGFLLDVLKNIEKDAKQSKILNKDKQCATQGWGLLVQGLQAFSVLTKSQNHSQFDMQSFVGALSSLSPQFRQIVIHSNSTSLSPQINFALQRISTCLTTLTSYTQNQWQCRSTVRRYTGYFKQEEYSMVLKDRRMKVGKVKVERVEGKTEMQAELFGGLGFQAQKNQDAKKMQKELREMIFPHLRVQNKEKPSGNTRQASCCEQQQACECKTQAEPVPQDLIILDEEQQDDEDIDV